MTREECEQKIFEKCREIQQIYEQYGNPEDYHLMLSIYGGYVSVINRYWEPDKDHPVTDSETPINKSWFIEGKEEDQ